MRLIFALLFLPLLLCAQNDIPTDIEATEVLFCQPGVTNASPSRGLVLEYGRTPGFRMGRILQNEGQADVKTRYWEDFILKVKAPLVNRTDFKVIIGMNHTEETYHFNPDEIRGDAFYESLDGTKLQSTRFTTYLVKSLNNRYYGLVRLEAGFNGDYGSFVRFDDRYGMYRAAVMVGRKWNDDLEFGGGVLYNNTFRRTTVWPFAFMNYTLSPKLGIEAVIPVDMKLRYDMTASSESRQRLLLMGLEYQSREHSVDFLLGNDANPQNVFLRRHAIAPTVTFQQQAFSDWTWFDVSVGYGFALSTRLRSDELVVDETIQTGGAPYARVSFFVSPPRKVICK